MQQWNSLEEALAWQEQAHPKAWDFGLTRIGEVWKRLGSPRFAKHIITIAGTNGKGSCVCWGEQLAIQQGLKVASFTSPHLLDYRERIRFNAKKVEKSALLDAFNIISAARGEVSLTYFEWSALAAFYLMAQADLDVALLEVGLGGRFDAVNLIDADCCIFTRIGLDHQDYLGKDKESIAGEKAGVLRPEISAFYAWQEVPKALTNKAEELKVKQFFLGQDFKYQMQESAFRLEIADKSYLLPLPKYMPGVHQLGHFAAMVSALGQWFDLSEETLREALQTTKNPARLMEITKNGQDYLIDVAHNADSAEILAQYLQQFADKKISVICSILRDKEQSEIFKTLLNIVDEWHIFPLNNPRASSNEELLQAGIEAGICAEKIKQHQNIKQALTSASADLCVIMGSFFTVSEALQELQENLCNSGF